MVAGAKSSWSLASGPVGLSPGMLCMVFFYFIRFYLRDHVKLFASTDLEHGGLLEEDGHVGACWDVCGVN